MGARFVPFGITGRKRKFFARERLPGFAVPNLRGSISKTDNRFLAAVPSRITDFALMPFKLQQGFSGKFYARRWGSRHHPIQLLTQGE